MSSYRSALLFVLLVALVGAVLSSHPVDITLSNDIPRADDPIDSYRLPRNVIPSKYTLTLEPNIIPGQFTFKGETDIDIEVIGNATNEIILHAQHLEFDPAYTSLWTNNNQTDTTIVGKLENKTDFYRLKLSPPAPAGKYTLKFKYTGILHDDMQGFYRSSYKNDRGKEIWLATTQFEPTYARRAFPCFDEPSFKAVFKIFIKHFDNYTAVSNMQILRQTRPDNSLTKYKTEFETTPKMSTYLVAFVISDFKYLSNNDGTFKVYARDNQVQMGKFAQAIGQKELKELATYTGISHVIPKMDNLAIPQFRAGAMENWGAVTYRESALLVEENVTTTQTKQDIATVISHEFAHQWFGNLVSPLWWNYLWLNEGFANYFQFFITDKVEPSWRLMEQFVIKNLQDVAFGADTNATQHAMDVVVNSPSEIWSIFDSISYSKAGSVIRMFSHVLTEPIFQIGLKKYLDTNQYTAVNSDALIKELAAVGKAVEVDMTKALESWVRQPGYPVVTVIRNYTAGNAVISQNRFLPKTNATPEHFWFVPINHVSQNNPNFKNTQPTRWLSNDNKTIEVSGLEKDNWVIFNVQQTGYYRVNYDSENWKLIAEYLLNANNTKQIHALNRAQLLDDSFNLAQVGELENYAAFFELSQHLRHDDDYVPWYAAFRAFASLDKILTNTPNHNLFKLYILRLTEKLEQSLGYHETSNDDHIGKLNRLNSMKLRCTMGSVECLDAAHAMLVEHVANSNKLSGDLQSVALCAGQRVANATIWENAYKLAETLDKSSQERSRLVSSLGCSSDEKILKDYLARGLLIESVFDRNDVIKAVYTGSPAGIDIAFSFIVDKFGTIVDYDGSTDPLLGHLKEIASRMTTTDQVQKLEQFIKTLPDDRAEFKKALEAAVSKAKDNIEWLKKHEPYVSSFLNSQQLIPEITTKKPSSSNVSLPSMSLSIIIAAVAAFRHI